MEELVQLLARALVDTPEAVELKVTATDDGTVYELKVAPADVGKLIGREGRTVAALRTVIEHAATRRGQKARLEIIDGRRAVNA